MYYIFHRVSLSFFKSPTTSFFKLKLKLCINTLYKYIAMYKLYFSQTTCVLHDRLLKTTILFIVYIYLTISILWFLEANHVFYFFPHSAFP